MVRDANVRDTNVRDLKYATSEGVLSARRKPAEAEGVQGTQIGFAPPGRDTPIRDAPQTISVFPSPSDGRQSPPLRPRKDRRETPQLEAPQTVTEFSFGLDVRQSPPHGARIRK